MSEADTHSDRAALLGGSFDPIHRGHLAMARKVLESVGLDRLIFLPCYVSPHKEGTVASSEQRLEMLRISLLEEPVERGEVSRLEIDQEQSSYSWETVVALSEQQSEVEWFWIVGTDQWNALERWARPDVLQEKLHFIVCTRGDEPLMERPHWKHTRIAFSHPASSTRIRADFESHTEWLSPGVVEYCRKEKLYS